MRINTLLFVFLVCFCSGQEKFTESQKKDFEIIKQLETEWLEAEFKMDTAKIASMMDERFMGISGEIVSTKREELKGMYENIRQRLVEGHIVESFKLENVKIQFYENSAVSTFICVSKGSIKKVPFENRRTRIYDVWSKQNGKWKAVSSQVSPLKNQ